ncbi:hypothetical protein QL285_080149 [Trifolium repens]|nr:hypothetical protein QL285_080149 [Trifolium repens]
MVPHKIMCLMDKNALNVSRNCKNYIFALLSLFLVQQLFLFIPANLNQQEHMETTTFFFYRKKKKNNILLLSDMESITTFIFIDQDRYELLY